MESMEVLVYTAGFWMGTTTFKRHNDLMIMSINIENVRELVYMSAISAEQLHVKAK